MRHIKSFISLSLVMLLGVTVAYAAPNEPNFSTYVVKRQVGSRQGDPVRVLKLVRFSTKGPNQTSVVSGDVLVYDTVSDDGVSVRLTTTSADGAIAGIAASAISSSDSTAATTSAQDDAGGLNWGYIVVHGLANAKVTAGSGTGNAIGEAFTTSTDSGAAGYTQVTTANGAATGADITTTLNAMTGMGGIFLDTGAVGDTSAEVLVRLE